MAEESDLEKTEPASPKRLEKAREEGDVPRSRELATCAVLFAAGSGLVMLSHSLDQAIRQSMRNGLQIARAEIFEPQLLLVKTAGIVGDLLWAFAPLAAIILLAGIGSPILIGGWNMSAKSLMPQFNRLNPLNGLSNLVSQTAAVELVKSIAKTLLVGIVGYLVIMQEIEPIAALSHRPVDMAVSEMMTLMGNTFLSIAAVLVLIAAIDVPYQLYHYAEKLKMTKEELKQEFKESEGNPEIKGRIKQQQREMARRRMMSEIPKADVVITNPTHYAVAIQYQELGMRAPVVVAKGADVLALKIREIASEHGVMLLEAPKLARALYAHTELGDEIPQALYTAVAEVLAYVFQMRVFKREGGFRPQQPSALAVPDALDPHSLFAPEIMDLAEAGSKLPDLGGSRT